MELKVTEQGALTIPSGDLEGVYFQDIERR